MEKMKERWIECQRAHICHAGPSHSDPPTMPRGPLQPSAHGWGGCPGAPPTGIIADKGLQDHTAFDISFVLLRHDKSCSGVLPKYNRCMGAIVVRERRKIPGITGKKHRYPARTCPVPFYIPFLSVCFSKPSVFGRQPPPPLPACASWTLD